MEDGLILFGRLPVRLLFQTLVSDSCCEESPVEDVAEDASETDSEAPSFVASYAEPEENEGDRSEDEIRQAFFDIEGQDDCAQGQDEPAVEDGAAEDSSCCEREGFSSYGDEGCDDFGQGGTEREDGESDERFWHAEHSCEGLSSCDDGFRADEHEEESSEGEEYSVFEIGRASAVLYFRVCVCGFFEREVCIDGEGYEEGCSPC